MNPNLREQHVVNVVSLAEQFADTWTRRPSSELSIESLEHFEPMVLRVFAQAKSL